MPITLTDSLDQNIEAMQTLFTGDNTFVVRRTESPSGLRCAVFFLDGMVNALAINQSIICPLVSANQSSLTADILAQTVIQINDSKIVPDTDQMLSSLLYGDTIILTEGDSRPVAVNTKGFSMRSTSEPDNERVLRGSREGFTEVFMMNLSMLRRRMNDTRLKLSFQRYGGATGTVVCLCYIEGVTPPALIKETRKRLNSLSLDGILDANYISECIRDRADSPFPTLGETERPDVVISRLLEGRIALLIDGTPVALTAPCILQECFQSNDDYYISARQASLSRILRILGFLFSALVPALYVAALCYHQELLPLRMLLAITAARRGLPLSALWEMVLLLLVFELLKEAGARTPGLIGSTMSIVGGLVLGQAAVTARFLSAPAVIIVAAAAVTGLSVPKLQTAALVIRFSLLLAGAAFGLYGVAVGTLLFLAHLCSLRSFGQPYLLNLIPRVRAHNEDSWTRRPWSDMHQKRFLAREEEP